MTHEVTDSSPAVRARQLSYTFRRWFREAPPAVDGVDVKVPSGRVHVLLGTNGAGKSTLLRLFAGCMSPKDGELRILGASPRDRAVRARFAYLPEDAVGATRLTPTDLLELQGALYALASREVRARSQDLWDSLGLTGLEGRPLGKLSRGQRRRAQLAQVLLPPVDLLLLDEPLSGVDPHWRTRVRQVLSERVAQGVTVLLSSHLAEDTEFEECGATVLERGRVKASGSARELFADPQEWQVRYRPADRDACTAEGISASLNHLPGQVEVTPARRPWRDLLG